jgi:hypothetical protein
VAASSGSWLAGLEQAVRHADAVGVGVALLAIAALVCGVLAFRYLYRARLIEDTPTSTARSAHQGYVELEGIARRIEHSPVTAPLSGLPCCWYRYKVEELETARSDGHTRTRWQVVARGESKDTFWLEDDTGRVAVDPEGAEIHPRYKDTWQSRSGLAGIARPTEFFVGFFATHSSATTYRFTEERINRNDPVYALGLLKNLGSHANAPTIDDRVLAILRDWKQDQARLHERFDLNRDGKIDEKEWLLARVAAKREAERAHADELQQTVEGINLLTHPRDGRRPYILSAFPQRELVARKQRWVALYGAGFFIFGTVAVWLYTTRFG